MLAISFDFTNRRVPNWLVLCGAAAAVLALLVNGQLFSLSWSDALRGAVIGFVFLLLFHVAGLMGAGDVKFAGVLGLWVGLQPLLPIWIGASLLAGVHAVLLLLLQRWPYLPRLAEALSGMPPPDDEKAGTSKRRRHIPFAAYLAIATLGWMIWREAGAISNAAP